ncbi:hypothetical protein [Candidatus Uabimicrobium amorphum]|uniref:Ribosomal protein L7/L12 C-terminal domain-containing protein n=1 Tax=Uabimicrobium amorphum TaxID=2596890 RepID=A0A5S9F4L8_UABAM|nr:hypothetical protein [Candidatus Uabimicrobium amorphum]BBM85688.1 hypothetical protein UABAM_04062 [Candidatus Uabimicrobium amorphum]
MMNKCRKCSNKLLPQVTICEKCAMPVLFEPESNHFPRPSHFLKQMKQAAIDAIKDTKPIPLFDDEDDSGLKSLSTAEVYAESGMDIINDESSEFTVELPEEPQPTKQEEAQAKKKKKTAYKTISIPLFDDRKSTGRLSQIDELEDDESEELIISDLEDDEVEDLGYEPEIVGYGNSEEQQEEAQEDESDGETFSTSGIDIDMEYMPLPGEESAEESTEESSEETTQEEQPKQVEPKKTQIKITNDNKQTQKISRVAQQGKLKVEYIDGYPDTWEWVLFENDTENRFGYQISGREKETGHYDFLVFPDESISSDSIMSKISDQQKTEIASLLRQGKMMESVRQLRKNFKILSIRQAQKIIKKFARQEKCKVQNFEMVIDSLPAKNKKVILRILRQGKTLEAIYLFRSMTKMGLKESREQIEYLCEKERLNYNPMQVTTEHLMIKKNSVDGLVIIIRLILLAFISLIVWMFFF